MKKRAQDLGTGDDFYSNDAEIDRLNKEYGEASEDMVGKKVILNRVDYMGAALQPMHLIGQEGVIIAPELEGGTYTVDFGGENAGLSLHPSQFTVVSSTNLRRGKHMEIIFNKQAYGAIKENLNSKQYIEEGPKEKLPVGKITDAPVSQKKEPNSDKFKSDHEVEKLKYSNKESDMEKTAKQELPGKADIDAKGKQFIDGGDKGDAKVQTKPAQDPKIKMQGLDASSDAAKQIDGGEKEKLQHPTNNPKIKIDWNVNVDKAIGKGYQELGDKGDAKTQKSPAKDPAVSQQKESGADSNIEQGDKSAPFQKQFSVNWKAPTPEEKAVRMNQIISSTLTDIEMLAKESNIKIEDSVFDEAYTSLVTFQKNAAKGKADGSGPFKDGTGPKSKDGSCDKKEGEIGSEKGKGNPFGKGKGNPFAKGKADGSGPFKDGTGPKSKDGSCDKKEGSLTKTASLGKEIINIDDSEKLGKLLF